MSLDQDKGLVSKPRSYKWQKQAVETVIANATLLLQQMLLQVFHMLMIFFSFPELRTHLFFHEPAVYITVHC